MNIIRIVLGNVWRWYFFTVGIILFILHYPLLWVLLNDESRFIAAFRIMRINARLLFFLTGISPRIHGSHHIQKDKTYVFCINHSSYIDIVTCYVAIGNHFHMMGKAELNNIPLFNIFFKKMNIPVNRSSRNDSHKAYLRACSDIDKNISIIIFPEGTIPANAPEVAKFKNGAFRLAIEKQVPCVPVTFVSNHRLMPDNLAYRKYGGQPGICEVHISPPIATTAFSDQQVSVLRDKAFEVIKSKL